MTGGRFEEVMEAAQAFAGDEASPEPIVAGVS
jgi:hypothetical protein